VIAAVSGWSVVAAVAAMVAAGAALVGLKFARDTVTKTGEMLEAMRTAHREEMAERQRALADELTLRRIEQVERVLVAVIELRDAVMEAVTKEADAFSLEKAVGSVVAGPQIKSLKDAAAVARARLPAQGAKLGASLAALGALKGPHLPELITLAAQTEQRVATDAEISFGCETGVRKIRELFETDQTLTLPGDGQA
jgi:hypothetical protein